jgi:radical SAM peptide maturase (CXXX-repeat target family)
MITPKNGLYLTSADFEQWQDFIAPLLNSQDVCTGNCKNCAADNESGLRTKNITFVVTERCNLNCSYCLSGDTLISMKDFSKKPISEIKVGDEVLAFNEHSEKKGSHNKLKIAKVENLYKRTAETIKITLEDNTALNVTPNHLLLYRRNTSDDLSDYKEAGKFKVGQYLYTIPKIDIEPVNIKDKNYQIGYFVAIMQGDGSYKKYIDKNGHDMYKIRLAVKDDEIIDRMSNIMTNLNIDYYFSNFLISKKYSLSKPAILANKGETYEQILSIINNNFQINTSMNYYRGYLAGIYDAEGHFDKKSTSIRITNTNIKIISEIKTALNKLNIPYCVEKSGTTINNKIKYNVRILSNKRKSLNELKFIKNIEPAVKRKGVTNYINRSIFIRKKIKSIENGEKIDVYNIGTSEKTYIANNILVHNCYETHKSGKRMTKEIAKQAVDFLFDDKKINGYFDRNKSNSVILEFIGGEPFLEIDLIDYITEYFKFKAFEVGSPWATNYMISISSNGVLYETKKVQDYLKRNPYKVSLGITIDGNKKLHDACRKFPNGEGSYDIVERSVKDLVKKEERPQTKITLCPANVMYLNNAIKNVWSLGILGAYTNCVYEEGWTVKDAKILYFQMKELADYLLEDEHFSKYFCSLFDESIGQELKDDQNWCFKAGTLILTPNGNAKIEDLKVGDKVISNDETVQEVENIIKRNSKDTASIQATGIFKTDTTLEHPYLVKKFKGRDSKNIYRYSEPEWIKIKDIKKGDKIALSCHSFGNVDIDKNIAYIVGRYIGDGWYSTTGYKICCGYNKYEKLKSIFDKTHINYSVDNYKTVKQFNIFKNNTSLINILSQIGHNAANKNIPRDAFKWNKESIESLLKGLFDADGCYNKKNSMEKFNTVSPILANDLLILLRGLGYFPTCYLNKRAGKSVIEGREVTIKDRYEIYFYLDSSRTRFCKYDKDRNICWTTVRDIKLNCEPYEVYNLTVKNSHTFIANGAIVHNCGGNGQMLAIGTDGRCFPCIRFMKYALSTPGRTEQPIGDIWRGLDKKEDNEWLNRLKKITMSSQSPEKCLNCKIATGCSLCTGYNYDKHGDPNIRSTYICVTHQARVMANCYYFNKLYKQLNIDKKFKLNIPKEWALQIVSEDEYNSLLKLGGDE